MLRGLYTAAAGMIAQQHRHDTVTNNISNINTPGYKQNNAVTRSFPEMLLQLTGTENSNGPIGKINTGVFAEESLQIQLQGDLTQTGQPSDFAILSDIEVPGIQFDESGKYVAPDGQLTFQPQAFFTVQDVSGETRYTRDGSFKLDEQGFLAMADGSRVLGVDGAPIQLPQGISMDQLTLGDQGFLALSAGSKVLGAGGEPIEFPQGVAMNQIRQDGQGFLVRIANGTRVIGTDGAPIQLPQGIVLNQLELNGQNQLVHGPDSNVGQLLLTRVDDPNELVRGGDGKFALNGNAGNARPVNAADRVEVRQGYIERSNVDSAQSMVDLMSAMRAYEANQKVIQFYDRSLDKAVNEVGRV
ncbi:flagellar hook-basal body protein [Paenibacillus sepulcri]|uniref:Flagellar hook-basal body protein n=1 Tax=Paenibacillus sepulcri TaxID=359917 RepID=A0ABS7C1R2_9BACL|nr:flagellar hook-basal body protein [Paenibacillus sepulcri]